MAYNWTEEHVEGESTDSCATLDSSRSAARHALPPQMHSCGPLWSTHAILPLLPALSCVLLIEADSPV